jgi:hypothetical protein
LGRATQEKSKEKFFFDGTKLPISLKTKTRRRRRHETKLPFAPSVGALIWNHNLLWFSE